MIYEVLEIFNLNIHLKLKIVNPCSIFIEIESFGIKL